ncbi:MAG: hypothetical protein ACTS73_02970 [Arsenophonus sp. NEOnobi-MAG3]
MPAVLLNLSSVSLSLQEILAENIVNKTLMVLLTASRLFGSQTLLQLSLNFWLHAFVE